jgi:hypothetical protein
MSSKEQIMTRTLYRHLVSTKTLIRVGFAVLSLHSIGAAFAQGATAMVKPPVYGTTWAAAHVRAHGLDGQTMALESSKTTQMEAPRAAENKIRLFSHRTGG